MEYNKKTGKWDGLLASDWIVHITKEVGEAIKTILPRDFNDGDIRKAIEKFNNSCVSPPPIFKKK